LFQKQGRSAFERGFAGVAVRHAGEQHLGQRGEFLVQHPQQLQAIHPRHEHVNDREIDLGAPQPLQCIPAAGGGLDFPRAAAGVTEDIAQHLEERQIVVHEQHPGLNGGDVWHGAMRSGGRRPRAGV
jgi:hypothetical protein